MTPSIVTRSTGAESMRRRQEALRRAQRTIGEVYLEGARNVKLAAIHQAGAVLRHGARAQLRRTETGDLARTRTGRTRASRYEAEQAVRLSGTGVLPQRNPFFSRRAVFSRVRAILKRGLADIMRDLSSGLRQAMMDATRILADGVKANIAPPGSLRREHVGLTAPTGAAVASGSPMPRLSPGYAALKRAKWGPRPLLVASGQLYDSIKARVRGGR